MILIAKPYNYPSLIFLCPPNHTLFLEHDSGFQKKLKNIIKSTLEN